MDKILDAVRDLVQDDATLDDALWVYTYEPHCHTARSLVYRECGVKAKGDLIAWDILHGKADRLAALARIEA